MNQQAPIAVIVLCGPERDSWINPGLMLRVVEAVCDGLPVRRQVAVGLKCGVSPVEKARNQIVQEFLASPCSWLVMVDNDVSPPANFLRIVQSAEAEGKLIFAIPTPMIGHSGLPSFNIGFKRDELRCDLLVTLPNGWNRCQFAGSGFLAMHRSVLERIKGDWFTRIADKSEDFAFCERAKNAGFEIWFNGSFQCDHFHSISLLEMLQKKQNEAVYEQKQP